MNSTRRFLCATVALLAVTPCPDAHAQLGGLIKKKVGQATSGQAAAVQSTGEPVAFTNEILELTPQRIAKIIAGKNAAKKLATAPDGPAALRKKLDAADERQVKIYEKHVDDINAWDEKRRDAEQCRDSVLVLASDRQRSTWLQRSAPLAMQMAQAQAKGDSAEVRRLTDQLRRDQEPTAADTAQAVKACPLSTLPAIVKQWMDIKEEMDTLNAQIGRKEDAIRDAEQSGSGLNYRQMALACERITLYVARFKAREKQVGFTAAELEALEQAIKDLDKLCT